MNETLKTLPPPDRKRVETATVEKMVANQFPSWRGLPVRPVNSQGWDNSTFRLGEDMLVRLPTADEYALAVEKEQRWLPILAPALPLQVPVPLAAGEPTDGYPHRWSVYRWIDGYPAASAAIDDMADFASDLAEFLRVLWSLDAEAGPEPGVHNWFRGGPLTEFDHWTQASLETLEGMVRTDLARDVWDRALQSTWEGPPVWFHGDIAAGNLLVKDGALSAVIDFGTCGVGDPACDLAIAWTLFTDTSRRVFQEKLNVDEATWERGQGWALWYALKGVATAIRDGDSPPAGESHTIAQILESYENPH